MSNSRINGLKSAIRNPQSAIQAPALAPSPALPSSFSPLP
jgi:hypothetical protein